MLTQLQLRRLLNNYRIIATIALFPVSTIILPGTIVTEPWSALVDIHKSNEPLLWKSLYLYPSGGAGGGGGPDFHHCENSHSLGNLPKQILAGSPSTHNFDLFLYTGVPDFHQCGNSQLSGNLPKQILAISTMVRPPVSKSYT